MFRRFLLTTIAALGLACDASIAQVKVLDPMESPASWKVITSDGVKLTVSADEGKTGRCLRLDYEFTTGAGYALIQKPFDLLLPDNYELAFQLRADGPPNNLEFKLLDDSGDNVWWNMRRAVEWPVEWTRFLNKKRDIEFAWGPSHGTPLRSIAKLEFAISSSSGGKGRVWLDELTFRELPPPSAQPLAPTASASSEQPGHSAPLALDHDSASSWSTTGPDASLTIDLQRTAEFGGLSITWDPQARPDTLAAATSDDGTNWTALFSTRDISGPQTLLITPGAEARFIRLSPLSAANRPVGISEITIRPPEFAKSLNEVFTALANDQPRGTYPRYFSGEQTYWTVIGAEGGTAEALISELGSIEVGKRGFSLEPIVNTEGDTLTWADCTHEQSLIFGASMVPTVTRHMKALDLHVAAATTKEANLTTLVIEYTLINTGKEAHNGKLHLTVRPFQVNPPWQRLNFEGGVSPIRSIAAETLDGHATLLVNNLLPVVAWTPHGRPRVTRFNHEDIVGQLSKNSPLPSSSVIDPDGLASGEIAFDFSLAPGESRTYTLATPLEGPRRSAAELLAHTKPALLPILPNEAHEPSSEHASIQVPTADRWISDTFRAQLAYILINRDGPAIQPGSRSYDRSWARDSSMTSAALLTAGFTKEVREWIDWFGARQFDSGKVPCVVDTRGPDPVPEYDSQGEYIWAVANYYRHTGDQQFLAEHWPRVQKAVAYIQVLRAQRMTDTYKADTWPQRACFGLVPESISHEGYSAKPMHSYWDDFFVLLGLKEAAFLAEQSNDHEQAATYTKLTKDFRACLLDSLSRSMTHAGIDYIPGCVELGDFDSTSTTIALFPCDEQASLPPVALTQTFDRYWTQASARMQPAAVWNVYTPYELRHVGAFVRLNQRENAYTLLTWFRQHQRPAGWFQWAEVVWQDPATPKFIGDMPHTWVGSDYLNSVISMFVIEDHDRLDLFAGIPHAWITSGQPAGFHNFSTRFGRLSASMQRVDKEVRVHIEGETTIPAQGIIVRRPEGAIESADAVVRSLPSNSLFHLR